MNSPLRIAVCSPQSALVTGGLERLCHELRVQLERRGHQVEAVRMPLAAHSKSAVVRSVLEWRLADLTKKSGGYDVVIATAFPSYYLQHPRKVTWLVAQFRFIYDLADTEFTRAEWLQDEQWRSALRDADAAALSESSRLLSISDNVGRRLQKFNGLHATTVYPPPFVVHEVSDQFGDFVLSVGRLEGLKRHHILIDAMAGLDTDARCVIVGTGAEKSALLEQIEARRHRPGRPRRRGVRSRVAHPLPSGPGRLHRPLRRGPRAGGPRGVRGRQARHHVRRLWWHPRVRIERGQRVGDPTRRGALGVGTEVGVLRSGVLQAVRSSRSAASRPVELGRRHRDPAGGVVTTWR